MRYRSWTKKRYLGLGFIVLTAFLLRLLYVALFDPEIVPDTDPEYYISAAQGLVDGQGYRIGNLRAYQPPLYSAYIAGVFLVFGTNLDIVCIVQSLMGLLVCLAVYFIGSTCCSTRVGLVSAALCAIYPPLVHISGQIWNEQLFIFLLIMAVVSLFHSERRQSTSWRIFTGILFGLAALTRDVGLFVLFASPAFLAVSNRSKSAIARKSLTIVVSAVLVVSVWTVRNYLVFKHIVPISTNGGINFYMGNNPEANGTHKWALPPGVVWNEESPNGRYEIEASLAGYKHGFQFIGDNPGRFIKLVGKRAWYMVEPPYRVLDTKESKVEMLSKSLWLVLHVILFSSSLIVSPFYIRQHSKALPFFLIIILMLMSPHLATYGAIRYGFTSIPFMALTTAIVWDEMYTRRRKTVPLLTRPYEAGESR